MKKSILCFLLSAMLFSNGLPVHALTAGEDVEIKGNALLIGNYLFELDESYNDFTLDKFISAARSIDSNVPNRVYYKDNNGKWYDLIEDEDLNSNILISNIENEILFKNGDEINLDSDVLTASDIEVTPLQIEESKSEQGTFDTIVNVRIKDSSKGAFADFNSSTIDAISSATVVGTNPTGTEVEVNKIDDKNIQFKITGTSTKHDQGINNSPGADKNQQDYNGNGIYGDLKFLMLGDMFEGVTSVADNGIYAIVDVLYNDESTEKEIISDKSRILTIENVDYGVLLLNEGIDNYNFTLNGKTINPTKVNDQGTIVKFETRKNEVCKVVVTSKDNSTKSDTIDLGTGIDSFSTVINNEDPDRVLTSGPVSYFDYYLVNYDENGAIRNNLEKTTFDTESEGVEIIDNSLPRLTLEKERTPLGDDIVINVDKNSSKGKEWLENLYQVQKDYGSSENSRAELQFRVDVDNSTVTILAKSTPIDGFNEIHKAIFKSKGFNDAKINFELVKPAGDLYLSPNFNWWANNDLLFELQDFNYAITNPIYSVYLDGIKLEGDCVDYHVVSSLVRLENSAHKKLTEGKHTITIKAYGYEDYTKTFTLEKVSGSSNPTYGNDSDDSAIKAEPRLDGISSASISIDPGTGGGSGGGGGAIRANIIFNFDQIANALILEKVGKSTGYSEAVVQWWYSLTKDAIITNDSDVLVDYTYYKNKVGINGSYDTFAGLFATMPSKYPDSSEYMDPEYNKPDGLYLNRPYNVKNMLHDGLLGDIYSFIEVTLKESPELTASEALHGEDIVVTYSDSNGDAWADSLINVTMNYNHLKYSIDKDNNTVILSSQNNLTTGENELTFKSAGYTTKKLIVNISKKTPVDVFAKMDVDGNVIVGDFEDDYINNLETLYIDGESLFNDEQVGKDEGSYYINGSEIVLRAEIFGENGYGMDIQHTLKIAADGFNDYIIHFTPNELEGGKVELLPVPSYVELNKDNTYKTNTNVNIAVDYVMANEVYMDAITEVLINNENVEYSFGDFYDLILDGSYFENDGDYAITIIATGYEDKIFNITVDSEPLDVPEVVEVSETEIKVGEEVTITLDNFMTDDGYINGFTGVVIENALGSNEKLRSEFSSVDNSIVIDRSWITTGENKITVKSTGYKDYICTITVIEEKLDVPSDVGHKDPLWNTTSNSKIYMPKDYYDKITEVNLDGEVLSDYTSLYSNFDGALNFNNLSESNGGSYASGTYDVMIKAEGYKDYETSVEIR
ncbi:MAG: hemoblobin-interacting domain-containing protein [Lachnospirales bacterium]